MPKKAGKVYLVGGGPGDPGLITVKGMECLKQADFILYDGLVNPLLLRHTHAKAERTARADSAGKRVLQQEQINQRLIQEAQSGKIVVRLKGGDPFIFGRGSEEAQALAEHGIDYEIVPGITAATAAAEYAGFSLTHRDHASAVCLVTGHEDPEKSTSSLDYRVLANFHGTLVFYMGLHRLPMIVDSLIKEGKSPETPAAIVTKASRPQQRVVVDELQKLPDHLQSETLTPPSLIIVGECVQLRETINWFETKPLFGKRIGITRPSHQADPQIQKAFSLGAEPVLMPVIEINPLEDFKELDIAIDKLPEFDWLVFTSANAISHFFSRIWELGLDLRILSSTRIACIGPSTAEELQKYQLRADLIPDSYCSEGLAEALIANHATGKVLWPRANRGRDVLIDQLTAAGFVVETVIAYLHQDLSEFPQHILHDLERGQLDWIGLSSPAIARQFLGIVSEKSRAQIGQQIQLAAISPITAEAIHEAGFSVAAIAEDFTWDGLFESILQQEQGA